MARYCIYGSHCQSKIGTIVETQGGVHTIKEIWNYDTWQALYSIYVEVERVMYLICMMVSYGVSYLANKLFARKKDKDFFWASLAINFSLIQWVEQAEVHLPPQVVLLDQPRPKPQTWMTLNPFSSFECWQWDYMAQHLKLEVPQVVLLGKLANSNMRVLSLLLVVVELESEHQFSFFWRTWFGSYFSLMPCLGSIWDHHV